MILFMVVIGLGSPFQFGFNVSVLSAPSQLMKSFINQTWLHRYDAPIPDETLMFLWSSIVSIFSIGAVVGCIISASLVRKYGKLRCQQCNNCLMLMASLILGCSKMAGSFEMILIGRFLYGFSAGLGVVVSGQFLAEIAPKKMRGFTSCSASTFATAGRLVGQIIGLSEALGSESLWPLLVSIAGITSLLGLVTLSYFPDTPQNLLMLKKDEEGCMKAMKILWGGGDHQEELEDLLKEQRARKKIKILTLLELIRERSLRPQLCLSATIITAIQFSGINAVELLAPMDLENVIVVNIYFYAYEIFKQVGIAPDRTSYMAIGVGAFDLIGSILCTFLIERIGRKVLLLSGLGVMSSALALLTVTLFLQDSYTWIPYCSIVLIFCFVLAFGSGPAGIGFCVGADLFSQSARTSAMMLAGFQTWIQLYLLGMIFPYIVNGLGHFCFLIFLCVLLISGIVLYLFLPETKGKSITEITEEVNQMRCVQICCRGATKDSLPANTTACTKM